MVAVCTKKEYMAVRMKELPLRDSAWVSLCVGPLCPTRAGPDRRSPLLDLSLFAPSPIFSTLWVWFTSRVADPSARTK